MKTAFCILLLIALFGVFFLTTALLGRLKRYIRQDVKLLIDDAKKPPSAAVAQQTTLEDLLDAIEWVESKGDADAIGDNGCAVGSFQIHKIYVDDVNRIICKNRMHIPTFTYDDRKSREKSLQMVLIYLEYYRPYGVLDRHQALARIHNAGPEGWRNDPDWFVRNRGYSIEHAKDKIANAKAYWQKVKARLEDG